MSVPPPLHVHTEWGQATLAQQEQQRRNSISSNGHSNGNGHMTAASPTQPQSSPDAEHALLSSQSHNGSTYTQPWHSQLNHSQHPYSMQQYDAFQPQPNGYASLNYAALGAASAASGASIAQSPPAAAASPPPAPFHSYPHITFRLPASFVMDSAAMLSPEQREAAAAATAKATAATTSATARRNDGGRSPAPAPSINSVPFQSLLPVLSLQALPPATPPPAAAVSCSPHSSRYHVSFRAMHRVDLASVAALHDELFPVKYDERFYLDLLLSDKVTLLAFLEQVEPDDPASSSLSPSPAAPLLIGVATGKCRDASGHCRRYKSGYVTTLGVDQRFRKIGLGKFLLKHIIRLIREHDPRCESIYLHVKESNAAAISMYRRCGFRTAEYLYDHYHIDGRDYNALKLVKWINPQTSIYDDIEEEAKGWCSVM